MIQIAGVNVYQVYSPAYAKGVFEELDAVQIAGVRVNIFAPTHSFNYNYFLIKVFTNA